jgi:hypothetical protein
VRQPGKANLDDGGELTGEVSVKWIRNQASHDFLAWAEDLRGTTGSLPLERMRKGGEPGNRGYTLWWPGKQNGNSG